MLVFETKKERWKTKQKKIKSKKAKDRECASKNLPDTQTERLTKREREREREYLFAVDVELLLDREKGERKGTVNGRMNGKDFERDYEEKQNELDKNRKNRREKVIMHQESLTKKETKALSEIKKVNKLRRQRRDRPRSLQNAKNRLAKKIFRKCSDQFRFRIHDKPNQFKHQKKI